MTSRDSLTGLFLPKVLQMLVSVGILILFVFIVLHRLPGGPFDPEGVANPVVRQKLTILWGLDQPLPTQFIKYFVSVLQGDFGVSLISPGKSVTEILGQGLSQSAGLVAITLFLVYGFSLAAALVSTLSPNSWLNKILGIGIVLGLSMPSLLIGPVLIYFFGFVLNLLPTAFLEYPQSYLLPVVTLMFRPWAQLTLLLKNSLNENLQFDYIRTAKAKGLSGKDILLRHVLKNSLIPIVALGGPTIVGLISGTFMVEIIFSIPGLGRQFVDSLNLRDYPVVTGLVIFYGVLMIVLTQGFEGIAQYLDPRLRNQR